MTSDNLLVNFDSPCGRYTLTVEDNGKVAYAYLKQLNGIVGDIWLYNRCATPSEPEWHDRTKIPFANCRAFMSEEGRLTSPVGSTEIKVDWEYEVDSPVAYVYVGEDLYGVVGVNDKPGYARFATRDSPIARVMQIEE